ncbi:hypothetical protein U9M48_029931 [Paspalum notatum var. saurae]|uniref:Uncharacterized protein n=1 Tax=Paspalum notatum var. saurae TaxID=547442 RepID=A0AAQ3TZM7_PASNO
MWVPPLPGPSVSEWGCAETENPGPAARHTTPAKRLRSLDSLRRPPPPPPLPLARRLVGQATLSPTRSLSVVGLGSER